MYGILVWRRKAERKILVRSKGNLKKTVEESINTEIISLEETLKA